MTCLFIQSREASKEPALEPKTVLIRATVVQEHEKLVLE